MAKLFRSYGNVEAADGVWVPCRPTAAGALEKCDDGKGVIAFKIRRMPDGKRRELRYSILGRQSRLETGSEGGVKWDSKTDKNETLARAVAAWCLLDSRNLQHVAADDLGASQWSEALGSPVKAGEDFDLSGKWNEKAKELYLDDCDFLVNFVVAQQAIVGAEVAKDEEGKGKVS